MTSGEATTPRWAYRLGWGSDGLAALATCDVVVIVDVLRFSSAVSAAVEVGAAVVPSRWDDADPVESGATTSLSPVALLRSRAGDRIVLPSPNGSALAVEAAERGVPFVLAGCLRNASATARRAAMLAHDGVIAVVAAGERWHGPDSGFRPATEDLLGAGAILHALDPSGSLSAPACDPAGRAARAAFLDARPLLHDVLAATTSGEELIARGAGDDVAAAAQLDVTDVAAQLLDGAFTAV